MSGHFESNAVSDVMFSPRLSGQLHCYGFLSHGKAQSLFRAQGLQVGVVKRANSVELCDIKVGRDFGTTIEIVQGVTPSDEVILNPADSLVTGDVVRVSAPSPIPAVAKK